jgi:hypothetical protein
MDDAPGTITLTLNSITCNGTSEDHDEVFIVWQPDATFPHRFPVQIGEGHSMGSGDTWPVNQTMSFTRDVLITLYDHDESATDRRSDYLVSYDYTPADLPSSVTLRNTNGADYTLNITVQV